MGHLTYFIFDPLSAQPKDLADSKLFWAKNTQTPKCKLFCVFRFLKLGLILALKFPYSNQRPLNVK
jgi:hypothetical protein